MSGDFLDTNVFVYLLDDADARKRAIAEALVAQAARSGDASISYQVVQETLHVVTRKMERPLTPRDAVDFMHRMLEPLWRVMPTPALFERALEVQDRYGYAFYDALIVAAALEAGCTRLYSEDLQDGQRIGALTIENPFRT
jgi:predicted nucleic acid-binding protein